MIRRARHLLLAPCAIIASLLVLSETAKTQDAPQGGDTSDIRDRGREIQELHASTTTTVIVDALRTYQRMEGFGATTVSLVYGRDDYLTPAMRAKAIEAVYGEVGLTMGQVEPGLMETPANATDPWSQRRNDNDDPFVIDTAGFNWTASDAMRAKVIEPARAFGLDNWTLANKINTRYTLSYLEPYRTSDYQRYLEEAAEYTVAGLVHWRDAYGIVPRWVAPWNEPTSGNGEIVGATTQTLVDLVKTIGRRMSDAGFADVKLVVPNEETVQRSYDVARAMLQDPEARRFIGAIGYHAYPYESPYSSVRQILEQSGRGKPVSEQIEIRRTLRELSEQYGIPVWMTEITEGAGNNDYPFGAFENVRARAIHIHDEILYAGASAYYGMNAMWDRRSHDAHFAGRGIDFLSESSTIAIIDTDAVYISGMGYAIGHYARWMSRGARVLEALSSDSLIQVTALRDSASRRLVLVIINNDHSEREASISVRGLALTGFIDGELSSRDVRWQRLSNRPTTNPDSFAVTLPAESITTLAVDMVDVPGGALQSVSRESGVHLAVLPNPAGGTIHIRLRLVERGPTVLALVDVLGRQVATQRLDAEGAGDYEMLLDLAGVVAGRYLLVLRTPSEAKAESLIVQ